MITSIAEFVFLIAIPIWSAATLVVKWIESWEFDLTFGSEDSRAATPEEMTRRIALLEDVVQSNRPDPASEFIS